MKRPVDIDGRATLHTGDALAVLAGLPDCYADAVITDPPYSSGGMVRGDRTTTTKAKYVTTGSSRHTTLQEFSGDNRDQRAYQYWCALWLAEALRCTRPGGVLLMFTDWRQLPATTDAVQAGGWVWRGVVPWVKINARPAGGGRFTNQCEYVVWASNGVMGNDFTPGATLPGFYRAEPDPPPAVAPAPFYEALPPRNRHHITQKPLDLMRSLVRIARPAGGLILDPFMGSGTTGVAALQEGFRFAGVEQHRSHRQVAELRIREVLQRAHSEPDLLAALADYEAETGDTG